MYGERDDEDELAALLDEQRAAAPVPAPAAAPAPAQAAPAPSYADAFDGFGDMPLMPEQQRVELEAPPERADPGIAPTVIGGVLDVLINKGRGIPQIVAGLGKGEDVDYDNWKRKKEWATAVNGGGRGGDPRSLWLRQQQMQNSIRQREADRLLRERGLTQNDERIKIAQGGQQLKETAQDRELNPENAQLQASKRELYAMGARPGSLDGLDQKAVDGLKTYFAKDLETRADSPLAQQDVQHGAAKAEANSAATLPDRLTVADHMTQNRLTGGLTPDGRDSLIADWERLHPGMYVDSTETFARNRLNAGRGEVKARADEQQAARLMAAVKGMREIIQERASTPASDAKKHYELYRKYNIASSKATGALSELSHNNTEHGRELDASKIPSYVNPDAAAMLEDAADIYGEAAGAIMATYGVKIGTPPTRPEAAATPAPSAPPPIVDVNDPEWDDTNG